MKSAEKMAADIAVSLQRQSKQLSDTDKAMIRNCCELFLLMADNEKTHDKQLEEAKAVLESTIADIAFEMSDKPSIVFVFWQEAYSIAKPIAREALTVLTKAALDAAVENLSS